MTLLIGHPQGLGCWLLLQTLLPLACSLQNIRVWDLQDYVCLQSFCGKLFTLGNCPVTSAYFHRDRSLICTTYNVSAVQGTGPANRGCPVLAWLWSLGGSGSCASLRADSDSQPCFFSTLTAPTLSTRMRPSDSPSFLHAPLAPSVLTISFRKTGRPWRKLSGRVPVSYDLPGTHGSSLTLRMAGGED